jgi:acetyl esterase/lipase
LQGSRRGRITLAGECGEPLGDEFSRFSVCPNVEVPTEGKTARHVLQDGRQHRRRPGGRIGDFTQGFPPTLLTAGTRDVFLSNTVRMHRKLRAAGVEAELHVLEAAPHGAFAGCSPEEAELDGDIRSFCARKWQGC